VVCALKYQENVIVHYVITEKTVLKIYVRFSLHKIAEMDSRINP